MASKKKTIKKKKAARFINPAGVAKFVSPTVFDLVNEISNQTGVAAVIQQLDLDETHAFLTGIEKVLTPHFRQQDATEQAIRLIRMDVAEKSLKLLEAQVSDLTKQIEESVQVLSSISLSRNDNTAPAHVVLASVGQRAHKQALKLLSAKQTHYAEDDLVALVARIRSSDPFQPIGTLGFHPSPKKGNDVIASKTHGV